MDEERREDQCVEGRTPRDTARYWSVPEYDWAVDFGRQLSGSMAGMFYEFSWTKQAPMVEALTIEWHDSGNGRFRICDGDLYDAQMRVLLGIT